MSRLLVSSCLRVGVFAGALAAATAAHAQIFKCPVGGSIVFSQSPCLGLGDDGGRLLVHSDGRMASAPKGQPPEPPREGRVFGRTALPTPTRVVRRN